MKLSNLIPIREIEFKAVSKDSGKIVVFKNKDNYNKAMKAGTHVDVKSKQGKDLLKKGNKTKPTGASIFGKVDWDKVNTNIAKNIDKDYSKKTSKAIDKVTKNLKKSGIEGDELEVVKNTLQSFRKKANTNNKVK